MSPEIAILARVEALRATLRRPVVVALDGGSGAGKSTIPERLARRTEVALVPLDDFYQTSTPESEWPRPRRRSCSKVSIPLRRPFVT